MRTARVLFLLPLAALPLDAQSRLPREPLLQRPWLDWDRGAYDEALEGYLEVLNGPRGAELKDAIAEATGEVNPVREIAPNGARLAMGPDGAWLTYVVTENGARVTKVVSLADGSVVATLPTVTTALMSTGRVGYLNIRVGPELEAARRAVAEARTAEARTAAVARLDSLESRAREIRVRTLATGRETTVPTGGWMPLNLLADGDALVSIARPVDGTGADLDAILLEGGTVRAMGSGGSAAIRLVPGGRWVIALAAGPQRADLLLLDRRGGPPRVLAGRRAPAFSADGTTLAMIGASGGQNTLEVLRLGEPGDPRVLLRTPLPLDAPALSPTGATVAYQKMPLHDWEIYALPTAGGVERQLTFEIQHDALPRFLDEDHVLAVKGEPRHRRSYVYSLAGQEPLKLFHNNTVRTIAPEYEWAPTPDGSRVVIVADRDGDTASPERGVYLLDRSASVSLADVRRRLQEAVGAEKDLRARGSRLFLPIGNPLRELLGGVSTARIESYAADLFQFGSRSIFQPGNARTIEYLAARLREFGYEPEIQTFDAPGGGPRTANVIARLTGTTNPDVVYVTSAHLDSVDEGPGSDDDGSGITSLLEAARVLENHPLPATVEFVFFTGEEAGLYGSIEYARRAVADGKRVAGVVNNDMIGFTNDHRLDMTIRWSSPGIRDVMHGAAIFFTDLITYDARYYRYTDAASLNDAFGDIVGGMGAYPILGSPYYHQPTDRLETVNQRLVTEACKTTIASVILLASTPKPLAGLALRPLQSGEAELSWAPAPERGVIGYVVRWTDPNGALQERRVGPAPTPSTGATGGPPRIVTRLEAVRPGSLVSAKAIAEDGREGWDWATVPAPR